MQPLVFHPLIKQIRWGGRRLGTVLGKEIGPDANYAESWEIADHGQDQTIVAAGPFAGHSLHQLVQAHKLPLFGRQAHTGQFPLLAKFLDANDHLSVQVHPDDTLAREFVGDQRGKTEAWVILEAAPGSQLYVGLNSGVTETDLRRAIARSEVESLLHAVPAEPGDCLFVPAGTVHAIGSGVLLAEIQQTSDITFRLFDWNRMDANGQARPLHIEKAVRCIHFDRGPVNPVVPRAIDGPWPREELVRSPQFVIERHVSERRFPLASDGRFHVLMVLGGSGQLDCAEENVLLPIGQTVLLPADRELVEVVPDDHITLLDAFLP